MGTETLREQRLYVARIKSLRSGRGSVHRGTEETRVSLPAEWRWMAQERHARQERGLGEELEARVGSRTRVELGVVNV